MDLDSTKVSRILLDKNDKAYEKYTIRTRNGKAHLIHLNEDRPNSQPVLFIHGFNSSNKIWMSYKRHGSFFTGFAEKARDDGYDSWTLRLSRSKRGDLLQLAEDDLFSAITIIHEKTGKKIKIIAHSMAGLLCRLLTNSDVFTPENVHAAEKMISEVCMLATPHHGFSFKKGIHFKKVTKVVDRFEHWLASLDGSKASQVMKAFFQLLSASDLFNKMMTNDFNPSIMWFNAVAYEDYLISESAKLPDQNIDNLKQKVFDVHHFKIPFSELVQYIVERENIHTRLKRFEDELDILKKPPIYRSEEVYEWIFNNH
ncbi:MAG: esterase/lipase family protein [Candidatus Hodarchaeales archaeon]